MDENNNIFEFSDLFSESGGEHEDCPIMPMVMSALMMPKPFGMMWDDDVIRNFLTSRDYKILKVQRDDGTEFDVAVKRDESTSPDEPNIIAVLERELQHLFLNFLVKNS